jgi:hypothetical protein
VNSPDREMMLAVATRAGQTLELGMPGCLFQESLDDRAWLDVMSFMAASARGNKGDVLEWH